MTYFMRLFTVLIKTKKPPRLGDLISDGKERIHAGPAALRNIRKAAISSNSHAKASKGLLLFTLPDGSDVALTGFRGKWAMIRFGEEAGYTLYKNITVAN